MYFIWSLKKQTPNWTVTIFMPGPIVEKHLIVIVHHKLLILNIITSKTLNKL